MGPLGIATHGAIYLQVSPFWGWSTPQVEDTDAPGYTELEASASDIELDAKTLGPQLLGIEVVGRPLVAGERVSLLYGAGEPGASTDRFAERGSRFWFAVDGDGDGVRGILPDSPGGRRAGGRARQLRVTLPSVARPGERVPVTLALLDCGGQRGDADGGRDRLPRAAARPRAPGARRAHGGRPRAQDDLRAGARARGRAAARRGPAGALRREQPAPDLARRTARALGRSARPLELLGRDRHAGGLLTLYARDVAGLDVAALTDHDHWGMLALDSHPELWDEIERQTKRFHEPGRFVTLLGYEWTSWIQGHRHVLRFDDEGKVLSSLDPAYESPVQLWRALAGQPVLTFAHHSAGGPVADELG